MKIKDTIIILAIVTFMSLFSNVLGTKADIIQSIPGLLIFGGYCFCRHAVVKIYSRRYSGCGMGCNTGLYSDYPRRSRQ